MTQTIVLRVHPSIAAQIKRKLAEFEASPGVWGSITFHYKGDGAAEAWEAKETGSARHGVKNT